MTIVWVLLGVLIGALTIQVIRRLVRRRRVTITVLTKIPAAIEMPTTPNLGVKPEPAPAAPRPAASFFEAPQAVDGRALTTVLPNANLRTDTVAFSAINPKDYPNWDY